MRLGRRLRVLARSPLPFLLVALTEPGLNSQPPPTPVISRPSVEAMKATMANLRLWLDAARASGADASKLEDTFRELTVAAETAEMVDAEQSSVRVAEQAADAIQSACQAIRLRRSGAVDAGRRSLPITPAAVPAASHSPPRLMQYWLSIAVFASLLSLVISIGALVMGRSLLRGEIKRRLQDAGLS